MNYEHKYSYRISICLNYFKKLHKRDDLKRRTKKYIYEDEQARKKKENIIKSKEDTHIELRIYIRKVHFVCDLFECSFLSRTNNSNNNKTPYKKTKRSSRNTFLFRSSSF